MEHKCVEMRLTDEPFELIKSGIKTVEVRLYDEKRSNIKVGDCIVFSRACGDERLVTFVVGLHRFDTFAALYAAIGDKCGIGGLSVDAAVSQIRRYYSEEGEAKYGVLGIELTTERAVHIN